MGTKKFTVDARALLTLGRDSIKDHTTAIIELVKNSYDADAKIVEVDLITKPSRGRIRIADNGEGMTDSEVEKNWLRIGFSEKRVNSTTRAHGRRKTGEKGIGRLSADRLGSHLEIRTKARRNSSVGLEIDWTRFDKGGQELGEIVFPSLVNAQPSLPQPNAKTGTELLITKLRQKWTSNDIEKLHAELGILLPPFKEIANNFEIKFRNDILPDLNGSIKTEIISQAEIEFIGNLDIAGSLNFSLRYRDKISRKYKTAKGLIPWSNLALTKQVSKSSNKTKLNNSQTEMSDLEEENMLGELGIRLSFFPRKSDLLEGSGFSLAQLRNFLDKNAGIKIYRDLVRVKPYGDPESPEGDWLGLSERKSRNPAGAGRDDFRVGAAQIVGAVFITRDGNPELIDSSSREGLIDGDEFRQLKNIVMQCLAQIESRYHAVHMAGQSDPTTKAAKAKAAVSDLRIELTNLKTELVEFQAASSDKSTKEVAPSLEQIEIVLDRIAGTEKQIEEIASQNTVYRGLATVGIAAAVFGHETQISADLAQGSLTLAKSRLRPNRLDTTGALANVGEAEKYIQQIASWGKFALLRVKKDKRQKQKVSITKVIKGVLIELASPIAESNITISSNLSEISARTFPMDVEAVVINFVTNAYHAVKKVSKKRTIEISLKPKRTNNRPGFEIVVSDSGLGIEKEYIDVIWQPLFSTAVDDKGKSVGTGLGLSIVKSAVEELGGTVDAQQKGPLGGAVFKAWFPES